MAQTLPSLGESASEGLNAAQERSLGDEIMRQIRSDPAYLDDPVMLAYVQTEWQRLLTAARARGNIAADQDLHGAWDVFLVKDRSVNAFALPGGFIGLHLGLVALTTSSDELASVLAHEMSHVTQRHIARQFSKQGQQSAMGLAAMVLGVLAASRNPTMAGAIMTTGQAAAIQGQLNFSRDMEREADRIGFGVLTEAGFDAWGMANLFEEMGSADRFNDDQSFPYLRTHPLTTERIAEAKSRAGRWSQTAASAPASLEHALMQGRAKVLMDDRAQSLSRLAADQGSIQATKAQRVTALSAAALAAAKLHDVKRADAALAQTKALLMNVNGDDKALQAWRRLEIELCIERGDGPKALSLLANPSLLNPEKTPQTRAVLWLTARAALLGDDVNPRQRVAQDLQAWVSERPGDAVMWFALADVSNRLDQPLRAARAEAEGRYAQGDLEGAVARLKAGQRLAQQSGIDARQDMDAAVIEARLKRLEQEFQDFQRTHRRVR
jgi:predicted Zn-dependent protease